MDDLPLWDLDDHPLEDLLSKLHTAVAALPAHAQSVLHANDRTGILSLTFNLHVTAFLAGIACDPGRDDSWFRRRMVLFAWQVHEAHLAVTADAARQAALRLIEGRRKGLRPARKDMRLCRYADPLADTACRQLNDPDGVGWDVVAHLVGIDPAKAFARQAQAAPADERNDGPQIQTSLIGLAELRRMHPKVLEQPGPYAVLNMLLRTPDKLWSIPELARHPDLQESLSKKTSTRSLGRYLDCLASVQLARQMGASSATRWILGNGARRELASGGERWRATPRDAAAK